MKKVYLFVLFLLSIFTLIGCRDKKEGVKEESMFDVVLPAEVEKYTESDKLNIYNFLVSVEFELVGRYEYGSFDPYDYVKVKDDIEKISLYFEKSKIPTEDLKKVMAFIEKEKPQIELIDLEDQMAIMNYIKDLEERMNTALGEELIVKSIISMVHFSLYIQEKAVQQEIIYYENYVKQYPNSQEYKEQLEIYQNMKLALNEFHNYLTNHAYKDMIIISRVFKKFSDAFSKNSIKALIEDLEKQNNASPKEIKELLNLTAKSLREVRMTEQEWIKLFDEVKLWNQITNTGLNKVIESTYISDLETLLGKNIKFLLDVSATLLENISEEDIKYFSGYEKPYMSGLDNYYVYKNGVPVLVEFYEYYLAINVYNIKLDQASMRSFTSLSSNQIRKLDLYLQDLLKIIDGIVESQSTIYVQPYHSNVTLNSIIIEARAMLDMKISNEMNIDQYRAKVLDRSKSIQEYIYMHAPYLYYQILD